MHYGMQARLAICAITTYIILFNCTYVEVGDDENDDDDPQDYDQDM